MQSVDGYVAGRGVSFCAEVLDLTEAEVSGVATFYTQYKRHPNGDYTVGVCTNTLCAIMGGDLIFDRVSEHLGIGHDETTEDGRITLERVECNAACDYAPVVMANWEFFDNQTPESTIGLVDELRAGADVRPTRGADKVCTFKEVSRVLAGFPDGRADEGVGAGPASLLGLRIAKDRGWVAPGSASRSTAPHEHDHEHDHERREGRLQVTDTLTPILTKFWDDPQSWTLATYERHDGYKALTKALTMEPQAIIDAVKDSSIRGRGGAGFPTGMKWSFMSPPDGGPRYLVVNADESEPGTCKDIPLMMANPHSLIEGVAIASYAIGCEHAFIYLRGEVVHVYRRLLRAVEEARAAGYLGDDVGGKGVKVEITVHAGAGAYICGEETALLDSLEGRRGQPRLKPPFPGAAGLYARPTSVNNVESIASVPGIILEGSDWFKGMGTEKSTGFGIFSLSGHVANPGQFEAPLGITMRELIDLAGGMRGGRKLKFWTPGGSSTPIFTDEHLDVPLDFDSVAAAGSMLGTRALQVFDETVSVVRAVARWTDFYAHESCGKCTPCREGTWWLRQIMNRIEAGEGTQDDIDKLVDICDNILGRSFCALGDAATSPITSAVQYFREEFEAGMTTPAHELFPPERSVLFDLPAPTTTKESSGMVSA